MNTILMSILALGALVMPLSLLADDFDALITSKVKLRLANAEDISASNIVVDTDSSGLVQLSGTVKTEREANKAERLTQAVEGVTDVKNEIVVVE